MNAETTRPSSLHCKNMYVASEIAQKLTDYSDMPDHW